MLHTQAPALHRLEQFVSGHSVATQGRERGGGTSDQTDSAGANHCGCRRDYMILERDVSPGSFFKQYPRHRQLISINKRFAGQTSKEFHMRVKSACGGGEGGIFIRRS